MVNISVGYQPMLPKDSYYLESYGVYGLTVTQTKCPNFMEVNYG